MGESAAPSPGRIFISYRREDTAYPAGWLYDRLAGRYGDGQIFKDVDSIELGDDFVEVITSAVGNCDVLLALVGEEWLTITDADGRRRLDDPNDFVRLEIEAALTRNVRVIPILVDGSRMPHAEEVPASLAGLARRQALELSPTRFDSDTGRLLKVLDKTLAEVRIAHDAAAAASEPAAKAADPSTTEPPVAPENREQTRQSRVSDGDLFPSEVRLPSTGEPTDGGAPASTPTPTPPIEGPQAVPQSQPEAPSSPPTAPASPTRAMWRFSGIAALASSALMLLCIVLPQQYGTSTWDNDRIKATYLLCLGLVVLSLGCLTLTARWRIHGLGGVIGAASVSTVVAFDMVNTINYRIGSSELGPGFFAGCLAPLVLFAAGALAVAAARRESDAGFAAFHASDWTSWVVLILAVAGALVLVPAAMETYSSYPGWGLQGIWLAVLAVAVPLTALLTRPVLLGRWLLLGWTLACATIVLPIWMSWKEYDGSSHGMWFVMLTLAATACLTPTIHRSRSSLPTAPASPTRAMWRLSGIAALASSALMLLCIVLPQQYGTSTWDNDRIKATYLLCLGLVVLSLGCLTLTARWRIHGLGGVIGAASVSTVVAFDMVNTINYRIGSSELGPGFFAGCLAPLVLFAAGALAVAAARRESDAGFAAFHASDWTSWVVLILAVAGALVLVPAAMETYSSYPGWGLQGIWLAVLAVAVPLTALLTRPVLLGRWLLLGWALACATLVLPIWMSWKEYDGSSHGMWFVMLTLAATACLAPTIHRSRMGVS